MTNINNSNLSILTADAALERLAEGNQSFMAGKMKSPHQNEERRKEIAAGQKPFAAVLGCADSRVPPEIIFDCGLGDLFIVRSAGQVIDRAVLGSLELGVVELGIPLILVLGHSNCGAVKETLEVLEGHAHAHDQIAALVEGIKPAVEAASGKQGDKVDNVVRANVELIVQQLKNTPLLAEALNNGRVKIVGARYDLQTGMVDIIV
ncbi:MAG: carbonic anhydrase [Chloroflexi bacterium]|nr:carbonic anhydrase [Chloroflexota bacterium]